MPPRIPAGLRNRVQNQFNIGQRQRAQFLQTIQNQAGSLPSFQRTQAISNARKVARRLGGAEQVQLGGAFGGGGAGGVAGEFQSGQDAANRANERRFQQGLAGFRGRRNRVLGILEGVGDQRAEDITRLGQAEQGAATQDLVSRGLTASTIAPTIRTGIQSETQRRLGRSAADFAQLRAGAEERTSGDLLGFLERKTEQGPNLQAALAAQEAVGEASGGFDIGGFRRAVNRQLPGGIFGAGVGGRIGGRQQPPRQAVGGGGGQPGVFGPGFGGKFAQQNQVAGGGLPPQDAAGGGFGGQLRQAIDPRVREAERRKRAAQLAGRPLIGAGQPAAGGGLQRIGGSGASPGFPIPTRITRRV